MKQLVFTFALLSATLQAQEKVKDSVAEKHYDLQEVTILGQPTQKSLSIPTQKLRIADLQHYNKTNVVEALNLLSGVSIAQSGGRNETNIRLRGMDSRRTPVYYDGVPIYVPYDGNFDLGRFLTYDIGSISVEKGLVSVKYGANAMGGAVNIVSRSPEKELDINGTSGVGFADGAGVNSYFTGLNVGTRKDKYYAMVSGSFNKRENFVLSKDFEPTRTQPEYIRRHAETFDKKIRAKIGYTPNETDEYTLGMVTQQAHKDISPNVNGGIFRDYPVYNKNSLYLKSKTLIAPKTFANFTGYYDTYYNQMNAYDNDKYQTINNGFSSIYDDYSLGGVLTFSTEYFKYNALSLSINEKYNHHKEHDREIATNPSIGQRFKAGSPVQNMKDNVLYIGLEDVITFNKYFSAVVGAAYNQQQNIIAEKYGARTRGGTPELYAFDKGSNYAFDYKAGVVISAADNHNITISIAKRSRFASQKERYSERLGAAIPNPDLKSEYARVYDLTYTGRILNNKLQYEVSGFINEVKDAIYAKPVEIRAGVLRSQNINIANATYRGVEAALSYSPNQYLTVGGHYSFIEMKDQSDDNDEKFTDIPAFKLVGFATFSIPQLKTALHLNTETSAKRDLGTDRRGNPIGYAPEYTVLNAKLSVILYKGLEANFGVNNLFDRNYYLTIGYPQEGRNFITGLSYNF